MTKLTILLMLIALAAIPILASQALPWWGGLIVLVVEITLILAFAPRVISAIIRQRLVSIFRERSRALAGAKVQVHGVREIGAGDYEPDSAEVDEGVTATTRHILVDFTLTPATTDEYGPAELGLVPPAAPAPIPSVDDHELAGFARKVRLVTDEGENECDQLAGAARLRIVFAVPPELAGTLQIRYFFERFGRLELPPPPAAH